MLRSIAMFLLVLKILYHQAVEPFSFYCAWSTMHFTALTAVLSQHPKDFEYYHILHLPHNPPLYPVFEKAPPTRFSCEGRSRGYYADVDSGCQAYHFCWHQRLVSTDLCTNGTLFNEQFQVCDHFYNVRCGSPYEDS